MQLNRKWFWVIFTQFYFFGIIFFKTMTFYFEKKGENGRCNTKVRQKKFKSLYLKYHKDMDKTKDVDFGYLNISFPSSIFIGSYYNLLYMRIENNHLKQKTVNQNKLRSLKIMLNNFIMLMHSNMLATLVDEHGKISNPIPKNHINMEY